MNADPGGPDEGHGLVYPAPFRARFDEAGPDGRLRTSSLLRYAQDLAWQHSDALGFDRAWYAERELTWLVRAAAVTFDGPIAVGSTITGSTEVVGFRRVWSRRHSVFTDAAGRPAASVDIDWVLLDGRGAPTRIPPDIETVFGAPSTLVTLGRVALEAAPVHAIVHQSRVRPQELDPLDHVNNAVYADWLDEAVIAAGDVAATRAIPRVVRLEYAAAAGPDETVDSAVWRDAGGWSCRLSGQAGTDLLRARLSAG